MHESHMLRPSELSDRQYWSKMNKQYQLPSIFLKPVNHVSKINSLNSVYFLNIFITSLTIIYSNVKSSETTNCNQDDMVKYETQVQHSMMKQWHKNEGDFLQLIILNKTFIGIYFLQV